MVSQVNKKGEDWLVFARAFGLHFFSSSLQNNPYSCNLETIFRLLENHTVVTTQSTMYTWKRVCFDLLHLFPAKQIRHLHRLVVCEMAIDIKACGPPIQFYNLKHGFINAKEKIKGNYKRELIGFEEGINCKFWFVLFYDHFCNRQARVLLFQRMMYIQELYSFRIVLQSNLFKCFQESSNTKRVRLKLHIYEQHLSLNCVIIRQAGICYCWCVSGISHEVVTNDADCNTLST